MIIKRIIGDSIIEFGRRIGTFGAQIINFVMAFVSSFKKSKIDKYKFDIFYDDDYFWTSLSLFR